MIGIQFTVPIYSGGMVSSQVRQAVYQHRAAKERVERVARQTEHDARDAYLGVLSEISHVQALRRALESNATALNATDPATRRAHAPRWMCWSRGDSGSRRRPTTRAAATTTW